MSFLGLLAQSAVVTRQPANGVDAYGLPTATWTVAWYGRCRVQPLAGDEERSGRETVEVRYRVFLPPEADIVHSDRISVDGGPALNVETVNVWPGRDGSAHHLEVTVRQEM